MEWVKQEGDPERWVSDNGWYVIEHTGGRRYALRAISQLCNVHEVVAGRLLKLKREAEYLNFVVKVLRETPDAKCPFGEWWKE